MRYCSYLFILVLICSCKQNPTTIATNTYLGGQIINPQTDNVVIFDGKRPLDTVVLDSSNKFIYSFEKNPNGIYSIKHNLERQNIFLEPGDSLLLRINTYEFDESLTYTGKGENKNNFLMDLFLANENNGAFLVEKRNSSPKIVNEQIEERREKLQDKRDKLIQRKSLSSEFKSLSQKSVDYEYYDMKERYAFLFHKYNKDTTKALPDDYFDYRQNLDVNDETLLNHYGYRWFLEDYISNLMIENCIDEERGDCQNLNTNESYISRIEIADSLFESSVFKSEFLKRYATSAIISSNEEDDIESLLNTLDNIKTDDDDFEEIYNTAKLQKNYLSGNKIKDRLLIDAETKQTITLGSVIKNPTVIFTWTIADKTETDRKHKEVQKLRTLFPNVDFIGINIDMLPLNEWLLALDENHYDKSFEYQLKTFRETVVDLKRLTSRLLFLDSQSNVLFRSLNIGRPEFKEEIETFLKDN